MNNKESVVKHLAMVLNSYKGELGMAEIKKLILKDGVDGKFENGKWINGKIYVPKHTSVISLASRLGYKDLVSVLIENGADVNSHNGKNKTALTWASFNEYTDITKILIDAGADVNITDEDGYTILILSFLAKKSHKSINICSMLIDAGADIDACTKKKETALMFAADGGYTDIARMLIDANAMINLRNNFKETALDIALKRKHFDIASMLKGSESKDINYFSKNYKNTSSISNTIIF